MPNAGVKLVTLNGDRYDLTFENGKKITVGAITSEGKQRRDDPNYDHVVQFSDGTVQKHVVSTKIMVLPDYPALQG